MHRTRDEKQQLQHQGTDDAESTERTDGEESTAPVKVKQLPRMERNFLLTLMSLLRRMKFMSTTMHLDMLEAANPLPETAALLSLCGDDTTKKLKMIDLLRDWILCQSHRESMLMSKLLHRDFLPNPNTKSTQTKSLFKLLTETLQAMEKRRAVATSNALATKARKTTKTNTATGVTGVTKGTGVKRVRQANKATFTPKPKPEHQCNKPKPKLNPNPLSSKKTLDDRRAAMLTKPNGGSAEEEALDENGEPLDGDDIHSGDDEDDKAQDQQEAKSDDDDGPTAADKAFVASESEEDESENESAKAQPLPGDGDDDGSDGSDEDYVPEEGK